MHELPRLEVFHGGDDAKSALALGATHGANLGCLRSEETDKRRMERIQRSRYKNAIRFGMPDEERVVEIGRIGRRGRYPPRPAIVKCLRGFLPTEFWGAYRPWEDAVVRSPRSNCRVDSC